MHAKRDQSQNRIIGSWLVVCKLVLFDRKFIRRIYEPNKNEQTD